VLLESVAVSRNREQVDAFEKVVHRLFPAARAVPRQSDPLSNAWNCSFRARSLPGRAGLSGAFSPKPWVSTMDGTRRRCFLCRNTSRNSFWRMESNAHPLSGAVTSMLPERIRGSRCLSLTVLK
jgi:hypothetical protein